MTARAWREEGAAASGLVTARDNAWELYVPANGRDVPFQKKQERYPAPDRMPGWQDFPGFIFQASPYQSRTTLHVQAMYGSAYQIALAILRRESIAVLTDFDGDGKHAGAILKKAFDAYSAILHEEHAVRCFVDSPTRAEGHGINIERGLAERMRARGVRHAVAVDSGIGAVETAERFRAAGVSLHIYDHHAPERVNGALHVAAPDYLVNPQLYLSVAVQDHLTPELDRMYHELRQYDSALPFQEKGLAEVTGSGLAWILCRTIGQVFEELASQPGYDAYLDAEKIVGLRSYHETLVLDAFLGTVSDVGDLSCWPNSQIALEGAKALKRMVEIARKHGIQYATHPGIFALLERTGQTYKLLELNPEREYGMRKIVELIQFHLNPPINAWSRVGSLMEFTVQDDIARERTGEPDLALELVLTDSPKRAQKAATILYSLNDLRRDLQKLIGLFRETTYGAPLVCSLIPGTLDFKWDHVTNVRHLPYLSELRKSKFSSGGLAGLGASDDAAMFGRATAWVALSWLKVTHKAPKEDEILIGTMEGYNLVRQVEPKQGYAATISFRNPDGKAFWASRLNIGDFIDRLKEEGVLEAGGGRGETGGGTIRGESAEEVLSKIRRMEEIAARVKPHFSPRLSARGHAMGRQLADALEGRETMDERKSGIKRAFGIAQDDTSYHKRNLLLSGARLMALGNRKEREAHRYLILAPEGEESHALSGLVVEIHPGKGRDLAQHLESVLDERGVTPPLALLGSLRNYYPEDRKRHPHPPGVVMKFEPIDCIVARDGNLQAFEIELQRFLGRTPGREVETGGRGNSRLGAG